MNDLQQQLLELRARMERAREQCDARFAVASAPARGMQDSPCDDAPHPSAAHDFFDGGEEVETSFGRHFEAETLFRSHRRHGSADIGALADLPPDLLHAISAGESPFRSRRTLVVPCTLWHVVQVILPSRTGM